MLSSSTDALLQGLFDCGAHEKGHAFIREHAAEITSEFVSALRQTSMDLLTGEQAAPDLAPVFAELAIAAAIVLGDDDAKGMSLYCKGSILARLGRHREAIGLLAEAAAYFRLAENSRQIADCLYDAALCHQKLGEHSRALRLLEEVLPFQNTKKERADTLAFMLVLMQQSGSATYVPLLKNKWVEMGDPAPPRRRTHGGAGAGALALVKPLPPKAVAGRPGFTRAKRPRLQSPPADRWAAIQDHALRAKPLARRYITHSKFKRATYVEDMFDLLRRSAVPLHRYSLHLREAVDIEEKSRIGEALSSHHPYLKDCLIFRNSIPHFLISLRTSFFVIGNGAGSPDNWPPYAYGMATRYVDTFNDKEHFGLEALVFADEDTEAHLMVIEEVRKMAHKLNLWSLCISDKSLSHGAAFRALMRRLGVDTLPSVPMQGRQRGVYSAFTDAPDTALFFARCIPLRAQLEQWDFDGELAAGHHRLYRGEGRKQHRSPRASWDFAKLDEVARHFFAHGFHGRADGRFPGTLQAQLLHQGYVDQPTVSLSASKRVCAYYATDKHRRQGGGIVFTIDSGRLLRTAGVYDSLATLKKNFPWVLGGFYKLITKVMRALDQGEDVRNSGAFLARCHSESRRRVELFGGGQSFGPAIDWANFLGGDEFNTLLANGISAADLDEMNQEFETFWNISLGRMVGADEIDADSGRARSIDLSRAYFAAFDQVQLKLKEIWRLNQFSEYNHPGWDLSPFGYVAKTIRDQEYFSSGDVPGNCIIEATIVDMRGRKRRVLPNPMSETSP
jgi:tetratricopeptide (TPR) repeat protein